ncbi:MAG: flagellar basal body L-ring protein FlgH [Epsilonproteobacteria bacterium]|nr:flagellar basal body L-ring protein FlgH [Campylobacterota bacterium]
MSKNIHILSLLSLSIFILGCSTHPMDPSITMKPPSYVEQLPPKVTERVINNEGSLFGRGESPLFADRKAMRVNDIVTVVIDEKIFQSSSGKKKLQAKNNNQISGGLITANNGGALAGVANAVNGFTNLGFQSNSNNSFTASGTNSRDEKFTTTLTARIIKVLSNGNYFIQGSRELLVNGNKQIIQISGVIRGDDIDERNTINSKYIADAKIYYTTQGDIDQINKKPWGSRIIEAISPF